MSKLLHPIHLGELFSSLVPRCFHRFYTNILIGFLFVFILSWNSAAQNPFLRFSPEPEQPANLPAFEGKFSTLDQETIVWMGGENWVRQQRTGILERALLRGWGKNPPRFRSMAWEGDTVHEQFRDLNFGSWKEQLEWVGATSVWMGFGAMEALEGPENLPRFIADYNQLLDQALQHTPRIILFTPLPYEACPFPKGPDLISRNQTLGKYAQAIRQIAEWRGLLCVDLYQAYSNSNPTKESRWTWNGIHWTTEGQWQVAVEIGRQLKIPSENLADTKSDAWLEWIQDKNRWWFEVWRPMNWAFMYGDRTTQLFAQPYDEEPWLREELEQFQSLIYQQEKRLADAVAGREVAETLEGLPNTSRSDEEIRQDPQVTLDSFTTPAGLHVNLFAGESMDVINPTQIAWDEKGRLYIACSPTYPHIVPGEEPADYILVCEDLNQDGVADLAWKFAEGLHMTQGMVPADGGVYVCAGTRLLFFKDKDGDGRADEERTIFSGFGTGDAHQLVNSIARGPDGYFWMTQGLHILSHIETVHGVASLEKSGVWRWDPLSGKLEGFFNGGRAGHNCWGVAFDNYQRPFHKTGDRPAGYYLTPGWFPIEDPAEYHPLGSLFQTPLKTTALDFIGSSAWPEAAQNRAVLAGFMKHTVEWYDIRNDGSGFRSEQQPDLLQSTSQDFRPVDVSVGPDGAIYVCDFHNRLIGHYQHSYRDPARDHSHGRIWRIASKDSNAELWRKNVLGESVNDWAQRLMSQERWTRDQARRLLMEAPKEEALAAVRKISNSLQTTEKQNALSLQSLGILRAHDAKNLDLLSQLSQSENPDHRAYAARYSGNWDSTGLKRLANDPSMQVRLEALVTSAHIEPGQAFGIWKTVFDQDRDRFLDYTLINAARFLRNYWAPKLEAGELDVSDTARAFLEQNGGLEKVVISRGQQIYESLCLNCHQPDGKGLPGVYPPLTSNPWSAGPPERLIQILIHGLQGPLEIDGQPFNNLMPPTGLNDADIAATLNYVRTTFAEMESSRITEQEVRKVREATASVEGFLEAQAIR